VKPSKYNLLYSVGEHNCLFNALRRSLHIVDPNVVEALERLASSDPGWSRTISQEQMTTLTASGYIIEDAIDEDQVLMEQRAFFQHDLSTLALTVAPTMDCNFACPYCFEGPKEDKLHMSPEIMDATVSFAERVCSPYTGKLQVMWFGGEPLLALNEIELFTTKIRTLIERRGMTYASRIITNGYGLTRKVAERLRRLDVTRAQITVDGTEAYHDKRRFLKVNSGSTYRRIIENICDVCDLILITLRVNLDRSNIEDFIPLLQELRAMHVLDKVHVSPAFTQDYGEWTQQAYCDKLEYDDALSSVYHEAREYGVQVYNLPRAVRVFCGAQRDLSWTVDPSGNLHKCWNTLNKPEGRVGSVLSGVDEEAVARWLAWGSGGEKCNACSLRPLCMSGCAYDALISGGPAVCTVSDAVVTHSIAAVIDHRLHPVGKPRRVETLVASVDPAEGGGELCD